MGEFHKSAKYYLDRNVNAATYVFTAMFLVLGFTLSEFSVHLKCKTEPYF